MVTNIRAMASDAKVTAVPDGPISRSGNWQVTDVMFCATFSGQQRHTEEYGILTEGFPNCTLALPAIDGIIV